ncbi:Uncharacterised protein [Mycobacteroides abscessus subsp. abscessus]|nr:Uncharacterised protein [Mycobacteroides abscessus subsp. abscessus]
MAEPDDVADEKREGLHHQIDVASEGFEHRIGLRDRVCDRAFDKPRRPIE